MSEPIVWRRFEDEKPKEGQRVIVKFTEDNNYHSQEVVFDSEAELNIKLWYPYPDFPAPKPKLGQVWRHKETQELGFIVNEDDEFMIVDIKGLLRGFFAYCHKWEFVWSPPEEETE